MLPENEIQYESVKPGCLMQGFVKCFWHLQCRIAEPKTVSVLPDGYFDIMFVPDNKQSYYIYLSGLQTKPVEYNIPVRANTFAISFTLPAAEYLLKTNIALLINTGKYLSASEWPFSNNSFLNFDDFVQQAEKHFLKIATAAIDPRKQQLFDLLYSSGGNITVEKLSGIVHWSSRQINRYFTTWFGVSLKEYCNILRYRASFDHISNGQLYPKRNYYDQAHFIKEIKKYSGVTPKALALNKNDRFIQFSTLPKE